MATQTLYDVIVVGAGIEGSATAFQLSKRGVKTLLLEQFPLPHTRGSSHGGSRIIRKCYQKHYYTEMMKYCVDEWKRIQSVTGVEIFHNVGYMDIGPLTHKALRDDVTVLDANHVKYEVIPPGEFRRRFPNLRYDKDVGAVNDLEGGVLAANKCLHLMQKLFVEQGGTLLDGQQVKDIIPGDIIQVMAGKNIFRGRSIILCCGPWTNEVLKSLDIQLPLTPTKISVCYWPEKVPGSAWSTYNLTFTDRIPKADGSPYRMYGLVNPEYPGTFKLCWHEGPGVHPDRRDTVDSNWVLDKVKEYVRLHLPGLEPTPTIIESCFYTYTPDEDLILDKHPKWNNVVIGAGFSGHGFKLAPAVGNILADLALGTKPSYNVKHFKISRFDKSAKSKI